MNNTKFPTPTTDARSYSWRDNVGVVEASSLGFPPGLWPNVIKVYSPKSGTTASFVFRSAGNVASYEGVTHPHLSLNIING